MSNALEKKKVRTLPFQTGFGVFYIDGELIGEVQTMRAHIELDVK